MPVEYVVDQLRSTAVMPQAWFMVAVTPVMHNFWDEKENTQGRLNETINFFKVTAKLYLCCILPCGSTSQDQ